MNLTRRHLARRHLALASCAAAAVALAPLAPAAAAASCSDTAPALRLTGPATAEADGGPVELVATWRCSGEPAAGARLYASGRAGHVTFGPDGHLLLQFAGDGAARLVAKSNGERSNVLVVKLRG
jgi:hypothetical protein